MKERTYGIILGILNIVLLTVCGVLFLGKDKNAPEILLSDVNFVYAEEIKEEVLFEGVTAMDQEDGELTGSVVIEKIVTDVEKETATITYGVADRAGNVGKATCTVAMEVKEEAAVPQEDLEQMAVSQSGGAEADGESEISENGVEETEAAGEEELEAEKDREESEAGEGSEEAASIEENEEDAEAAQEDSDAEDDQAQEAEAGEDGGALPTAGEAANRGQNTSPKQNPGRPAIVLRSQEVKTKAGQAPAWVQVIEGLHDDRDNYETLLRSLKIKGDYDKDKAGTYNVTVTVTDGDGNESSACPVKIVVEAWE